MKLKLVLFFTLFISVLATLYSEAGFALELQGGLVNCLLKTPQGRNCSRLCVGNYYSCQICAKECSHLHGQRAFKCYGTAINPRACGTDFLTETSAQCKA